MKWDHERGRARLVLEADMAAALADDRPPELFKYGDQLLAGDDRQPLAHAGSGSLRRTTPV